MPTPINSRAGEIKLEPGVPQIFAFKFVTGKSVDGKYGPRVMFTAVDERKLWFDAEDGSDFERRLRELGVQACDFVNVTKIRHPKGGHLLKVERVPEDKPEAAHVPVRTAPGPSSYNINVSEKEDGEGHPAVPCVQPSNGSAERAAITPASAKMCAAFLVAIDAVSEAQTYADRRGLKVTFTSEDVRACAISAFIQAGR